jgi:hypothetical protein
MIIRVIVVDHECFIPDPAPEPTLKRGYIKTITERRRCKVPHEKMEVFAKNLTTLKYQLYNNDIIYD